MFCFLKTLSVWKSKHIVLKNVCGGPQIQDYLVYFNTLGKFLLSTIFTKFHWISPDLGLGVLLVIKHIKPQIFAICVTLIIKQISYVIFVIKK